jgi:hypothetical protein
VCLDGLDADRDTDRDLLVRVTPRHEHQDLFFACR